MCQWKNFENWSVFGADMHKSTVSLFSNIWPFKYVFHSWCVLYGMYMVVLYAVRLSARHSAVDCIMADDWQPWSACSSRCGLGTRRRIRRIVRAASNGGRPCTSTVQKGICYGTGCKFARAHGRVQMQGNAYSGLVRLRWVINIRQLEFTPVLRSSVDPKPAVSEQPLRARC